MTHFNIVCSQIHLQSVQTRVLTTFNCKWELLCLSLSVSGWPLCARTCECVCVSGCGCHLAKKVSPVGHGFEHRNICEVFDVATCEYTSVCVCA